MRVLLINQFYPPDRAPTGRVLHSLANALVEKGHTVEVISSRGSYEGGASHNTVTAQDGVRVHRVADPGFARFSQVGKLIDYLAFMVFCLERLINGLPRPDLVVVLTTPPYIGIPVAIFSYWNRLQLAHWIMDLYPDAVVANGSIAIDGMLLWLLKGLGKLQYSRASLVLSIGKYMQMRVGRYLSPATINASIPLWADQALSPWPTNLSNPFREQNGWGQDAIVFMYSGNLGRGHRFGEFLDVARRHGKSGPRWIFVGQGNRRVEIEAFLEEHKETRVELLPFVPQHQLRESLCSADVHLVSLDSKWDGVMVPSKIQGIFAIGKPVIFVGSRSNEIAQWIEEAKAGWVVEENDIIRLEEVVAEACNPTVRARKGQLAYEFAKEHFSIVKNCEQVADLLERCGRGSRRFVSTGK